MKVQSPTSGKWQSMRIYGILSETAMEDTKNYFVWLWDFLKCPLGFMQNCKVRPNCTKSDPWRSTAPTKSRQCNRKSIFPKYFARLGRPRGYKWSPCECKQNFKRDQKLLRGTQQLNKEYVESTHTSNRIELQAQSHTPAVGCSPKAKWNRPRATRKSHLFRK